MIRTLIVALAAAVTLSGCIVVPAHGWQRGYYGGYHGSGYYGYSRGDHGNYYSDGAYDYYRGDRHRGRRGRW